MPVSSIALTIVSARARELEDMLAPAGARIQSRPIQALGELGILGFTPFVLLIGISIYHAWKMEAGRLGSYATALELAMWGFVVCGMAGGFLYTWWPYILVGLITATRRIVDTVGPEAA